MSSGPSWIKANPPCSRAAGMGTWQSAGLMEGPETVVVGPFTIPTFAGTVPLPTAMRQGGSTQSGTLAALTLF